jgi:hypothetical protein
MLMCRPWLVASVALTCPRVGQLGDFDVEWSRVSMRAGVNARRTGHTPIARQVGAGTCHEQATRSWRTDRH